MPVSPSSVSPSPVSPPPVPHILFSSLFFDSPPTPIRHTQQNAGRNINQQIQQTNQRPRQPSFGSLTVVPRWTPPLSPSSKSSTKYVRYSSSSSSLGKENQLLSPQDALAALRTPGVPALEDLRRMSHMVGAASRTWLRDFLIRGGRYAWFQVQQYENKAPGTSIICTAVHTSYVYRS